MKKIILVLCVFLGCISVSSAQLDLLYLYNKNGSKRFLKAGANRTLPFSDGTTLSFRAIVSADLPAVGYAQGGTGLSSLGTAYQMLRVNAGATALEYFGGSAHANRTAYFNGSGELTSSSSYIYNGTTLQVSGALNTTLFEVNGTGGVAGGLGAMTSPVTGIWLGYAGTKHVQVSSNGFLSIGDFTAGFQNVLNINKPTVSMGNHQALNGTLFSIKASTITDQATAGSGTATNWTAVGIAQPTLAASNSSVTTTNAATLYIAAQPAAGTNQTITNPYSLWVDAGNVRLDGHLLFVDNTTDIGATGATRPRTGYFGTSLVSPLITGGSGTTQTLTLQTTSGSATTGSDIIFKDDNTEFARILNNGNVGIGIAAPTSRLHLAGNTTAAAWGTNGIHFNAAAATFTDNSTAGSGTATNAMANTLGIPTFAASNSSVTMTNGANLYIAGPPAAGTNVTITNPWALFVEDGNSRFDGTLRAAAGSVSAPAFSFVAATDYGMYQGSSQLRFAAGGAERLGLSSTGANVTGLLTVTGMGTDPVQGYFIGNDENAAIYVQNSSTGTGSTNGLAISMANTDAIISNRENAGITFSTNATPAFSVDAGQRVAFNNRYQGAKGSDVTAANDLVLSGGNLFHITGATQINAITTTNWQAGSEITLIFDSTPTVKNNTAGGAGTALMLLAGAADFVATASDVLKLVFDGTSWYEVSRSLN